MYEEKQCKTSDSNLLNCLHEWQKNTHGTDIRNQRKEEKLTDRNVDSWQ